MTTPAECQPNVMNMNCEQPMFPVLGNFVTQNNIIFEDRGGALAVMSNLRKRTREETIAFPEMQVNTGFNNNKRQMQFAPQLPMFVGVNQLQSMPQPLQEQSQGQLVNQLQTMPNQSPLFEELMPCITQYQDELEAYVRVQVELFRKAIVQEWQRHSKNLLLSRELISSQKLRQKEVEVQEATRQCAELEQQLACQMKEALLWKIRAGEAAMAVTSLQGQIDFAAAAAGVARETASESSSNAESAHVDLKPRMPGLCRGCKKRQAMVVVLPCRHLCISKCVYFSNELVLSALPRRRSSIKPPSSFRADSRPNINPYQKETAEKTPAASNE